MSSLFEPVFFIDLVSLKPIELWLGFVVVGSGKDPQLHIAVLACFDCGVDDCIVLVVCIKHVVRSKFFKLDINALAFMTVVVMSL